MGGIPGGIGGQQMVNLAESQYSQRLSQGVRSGAVNRDEFMALGKFDQQTRQMEGQFLKDGSLSPDEKRILDQRMGESNQMLNNYSGGDFHPYSQAPANSFDARRDNQLNSIYSGIRDGSLGGNKLFSRDEGAQSLDKLGNVSKNYGRYGMEGGPSFMGINFGPNINSQLGSSRNSINDLRNNWNTSPPSYMPDNASFGPEYGTGSGTFNVNPFQPYGVSGEQPYGGGFSPFGFGGFDPFGGGGGFGGGGQGGFDPFGGGGGFGGGGQGGFDPFGGGGGFGGGGQGGFDPFGGGGLPFGLGGIDPFGGGGLPFGLGGI